jgi:hypothetical protein
LKAASGDDYEPSFNAEAEEEQPKRPSPDLQQIMAAENSDDFEESGSRALASTPPPRGQQDDDDDDFDLLTPIDAVQPTHALPKLNLEMARLGTAHN